MVRCFGSICCLHVPLMLFDMLIVWILLLWCESWQKPCSTCNPDGRFRNKEEKLWVYSITAYFESGLYRVIVKQYLVVENLKPWKMTSIREHDMFSAKLNFECQHHLEWIRNILTYYNSFLFKEEIKSTYFWMVEVGSFCIQVNAYWFVTSHYLCRPNICHSGAGDSLN